MMRWWALVYELRRLRNNGTMVHPVQPPTDDQGSQFFGEIYFAKLHGGLRNFPVTFINFAGKINEILQISFTKKKKKNGNSTDDSINEINSLKPREDVKIKFYFSLNDTTQKKT